MLKVSPEKPKAGEESELELEIMDVRDTQASFGEGFPVAGVEVTARLKELETNKEETLHAHVEGDAGVYGIHCTFPTLDSYHAVFEWKEADSTEHFVHFDIEVTAGEPYYEETAAGNYTEEKEKSEHHH